MYKTQQMHPQMDMHISAAAILRCKLKHMQGVKQQQQQGEK